MSDTDNPRLESDGPGRASLLADEVYRALRESIIKTIDEPGAILTENAVAQRYNVARPTAKAALEKLVAKGLLHRSAHRAAQVPLLSRADIMDLYATRTILEEAVVAGLAAKGLVPRRALEAHEQLRSSTSDSQDSPFAQADFAFHQALVAGYGSPRLVRMHDLILGEVQLCMGQLQSQKLIRTQDINKQHQGVLDAIETRDVELAVFLIRRHIFHARDRLLTRFEE